MSCGSNRRAAAGHGRSRNRDQWVDEKLEEVSYEFPADDLQRIKAELQTVKPLVAPSKQATFKKMDRLLRTNQEVPAWLAESVRLLYHNNEFGDKLLEKLVDLGYDEENVTNPALPYKERRPRMSMPEFIDGRADEDALEGSDEYLPSNSSSNYADDGASNAPTESERSSGSDDSAHDSDGSEDYKLPVPSRGPRKSARASHLRSSFSELLEVPKLTSSEESEGVKEESGPDSSPRPIKEEDVTMSGITNAINTTYTIGRVSSVARNANQVPKQWSTSESDDTDPDLDDDDIKAEDDAGSAVPDATAPNGGVDRPLALGGRSESPEAMVHSPDNFNCPGPRPRRKGRSLALGAPRPVSNSPSFLNDTSRHENMRPEALGEDGEMLVQASPSPTAEEREKERVKGPKEKEVIVISSSSSGQLPKNPKAKKRVFRKKTTKRVWDVSSSSGSSPLAKKENSVSSKQSSRAKPQSKLTKLVEKVYVKKLKKMRKSRDKELKRRATKIANANITGSNRVQETAATAPTAGNGPPASLGGSYRERPARAVSMFSSLPRKGRGHGAARSSSGTASRSEFRSSRSDKKTNAAENSGSLDNTDAVNNQTLQVQARSSAVSDFPANPTGAVKRKPGRPVGSGLLRDKKLLEPTRLSKRLRGTSPPVLQDCQNNTANLQQASGNMSSPFIDTIARNLGVTAESPLNRKRGRPVGSTEAYLLARQLHTNIAKKEPSSPAGDSPSKRPRTNRY